MRKHLIHDIMLHLQWF